MKVFFFSINIMLFAAILSICALSYNKWTIYNEEMIVACCFIGFIILFRKSLGNTFKVTLDGRIQAIQEELLQFLNPNEVVLVFSNEQQRLLFFSLRICGTVVESLPMARCAPKCEKTVQALLCRNLNVKSETLPNATSSRRIRLQDDLVTGFHFSVSETLKDEFGSKISSFIYSRFLLRKRRNKVQIFVFCLGMALLLVVIARILISLGYVFMDDLSRALAQFYPSASGGMSGGSTTPPGPSGTGEDSSFFAWYDPQQINETGENPESSHHATTFETRETLLEKCRDVLEEHQKIASIVQQLFRNLRTTVPGGFQAERLAEMLENQYGPEALGPIRMSLENEGIHSPYFKEVQTLFRTLRESGGTEMQLRKEWQGRV